MRHAGRHRPRPDRIAKAEERGLRWFRACLAVSIVVYLGLAAASVVFAPGYPVIAFVLVAFGAHSAAYLFVHELRGGVGETYSGEPEE